MCRIASLFLLQRLKGSMSGDALDARRELPSSFFFSYKERHRRIFTPFWKKN